MDLFDAADAGLQSWSYWELKSFCREDAAKGPRVSAERKSRKGSEFLPRGSREMVASELDPPKKVVFAFREGLGWVEVVGHYAQNLATDKPPKWTLFEWQS